MTEIYTIYAFLSSFIIDLSKSSEIYEKSQAAQNNYDD